MGIERPEDIPHAFVDAWMSRDGDALAALFVDDADFVNVVGIWWEHRSDIGRAHAYAFRSFFSETRLIAGRTKCRYLTEDTAVVHCRFRLDGQLAPNGDQAGARNTILTFVAQRSGESWRVVSAQNTDIVPGAESQVLTDSLRPVDYRE